MAQCQPSQQNHHTKEVAQLGSLLVALKRKCKERGEMHAKRMTEGEDSSAVKASQARRTDDLMR